MIIVLYGPPGCGKGTQAEFLLKYSAGSMCHMSVGEILRNASLEETELSERVRSYMGRGELAPLSVVLDVVNNFMSANSRKYKHFLFDGFPRSVEQSSAFLEITKTFGHDYVVVTIDVPDSALVERLTSRVSCEKCGAVLTNSITTCPVCSGTVFKKRKDDVEEVIMNRLELYHKMYDDLVKCFDANKLFVIDGNRDIMSVADDVINLLKSRIKGF